MCNVILGISMADNFLRPRKIGDQLVDSITWEHCLKEAIQGLFLKGFWFEKGYGFCSLLKCLHKGAREGGVCGNLFLVALLALFPSAIFLPKIRGNPAIPPLDLPLSSSDFILRQQTSSFKPLCTQDSVVQSQTRLVHD